MFNKRFLFVSVVAGVLSLSSVSVNATPEDVTLQVGYDDPGNGQDNPQRSPIIIPEVTLDGFTLNFITPCDGYTLRIVNEDGGVEFSTIVPVNAVELVLPSFLEGDYELQLVCGSYYFYGYISL